MVPTQLYDLVIHRMKSPDSLRAVIVGGGAITESLYSQARSLGWPVLPSYGMTESSSQVATAELNSLTGSTLPPLKILPHINARINLGGFLEIYSRALLTAYAVIDNLESRHYDPKIEGWFTTEDQAEIEGQFLQIVGRGGDFVKIGGESVNLGKLNKMLDEIKMAKKIASDMAIFAFPDDRLGHVIHLVWAGVRSEILESAVNSFNQSVLPFERIREIHHVTEIPRSPINKLLKKELLDLLNAMTPSKKK